MTTAKELPPSILLDRALHFQAQAQEQIDRAAQVSNDPEHLADALILAREKMAVAVHWCQHVQSGLETSGESLLTRYFREGGINDVEFWACLMVSNQAYFVKSWRDIVTHRLALSPIAPSQAEVIKKLQALWQEYHPASEKENR